MNNSIEHSTLRIRKNVKQQLARLDFVSKEHSYNDIILELINLYNAEIKAKNKK